MPVVQCLAHTTVSVETNLIIQALELLPNELIEANARGDKSDIRGYDIAKLFEKLDLAEDVTRQTVAHLEIPFVSILSHDRPHLALHHDVMEDAATFADLVSWAFKSSDSPDEQEIQNGQQSIARAELAWDILYHIRRISGQNEDASVNAKHLAHWVFEARRLCSERGRADIGDQMVGQVLANAPEGADGIWPCEPVRDVLETSTQRRHLGIGFRMGKANLRGVTTRGIFEGGPQERALAAKFRSDADAVSVRSPFTARLLRSLAERYERAGRDEDIEADWRDLGE